MGKEHKDASLCFVITLIQVLMEQMPTAHVQKLVPGTWDKLGGTVTSGSHRSLVSKGAAPVSPDGPARAEFPGRLFTVPSSFSEESWPDSAVTGSIPSVLWAPGRS